MVDLSLACAASEEISEFENILATYTCMVSSDMHRKKESIAADR